jgi:wyosine [tRNA(Phe)-imidazoG37] synthetase (radical SAM superfamily)
LIETRHPLTVINHDRSVLGLTYVYAVVSRRAGGVSLGINLNPNHACNWRCIYCQVLDLARGRGAAIDLEQLARELEQLLHAIMHHGLLERSLEQRSESQNAAGRQQGAGLPTVRKGALAGHALRDLAFSGDGEPTTSPDFAAAVATVARVLESFGLLGRLKLVLITNGSMLHASSVQQGLSRWAEWGGEIWFKLDSVTQQGMARVNGVPLSRRERWGKLLRAVELAPTWLQTCMFEAGDVPPSEAEQTAYLRFLAELGREGVRLAGVLLYTLARPPARSDGVRPLKPVSSAWLEQFAELIRATGLAVHVSPADPGFMREVSSADTSGRDPDLAG